MKTLSFHRWPLTLGTISVLVGSLCLFSTSTQAQLTIQVDAAEKAVCDGVAQVNILQGDEWLYSTPIPVGASAEFRMNAGKYQLRAVTPGRCVGQNEFEYDGKKLHLKTLLLGPGLTTKPVPRKPSSAGTANSSGVSDFSRGSSAPISQ